MNSMTGFGRGSAAGEGYTISVELKTVNNRFLDVNLRLPSLLQDLESELKRTISSRLSRGRVDVNLQYERSETVDYEINRAAVAGYLDAIRMVRDEFQLEGELDVDLVARFPNLMQPRKEALGEQFRSGITQALSAALEDLEAMRSAEGELLKAELASRLDSIERSLRPIEEAAAAVADEYRQRLTKRITEMLARTESQVEIDQGRLAQEVAYLADRSDISEEIARLHSHIEHFRSIMAEDKEVGKRLDFLTQELNREANTIASKTGNVAIKENALAIKSDIEKIREQVQNVE